MISTILFDLDGTLYDRDLLVRSLAEKQYQQFRNVLGHVGKGQYVDRLIELDDHGYQPKSNVYAALAREFDLRPSLEHDLERHFWSEYDGFCELAVDTNDTLRQLRKRGMRLGIITNGGAKRQHAKIEALGIRSFFDVIVVSEEVGFRKPDPEIFHLALDGCDSSSDESLYVGDNPQADVEGAKNAGLRAVWKYVPYWQLSLSGIPTISRLSELLPLLSREA